MKGWLGYCWKYLGGRWPDYLLEYVITKHRETRWGKQVDWLKERCGEVE